LVSVTTDGARNMTGKNIGLQAIIINEMKLKELSPPLFFHCIIHQHALCAKIMSWDSIMKEVVSIINFIRSNGLNHRQFQNFLIEINAEYGDVLYYTAVRWLSRGRVLERFFMLRQEIYNILKEKGKDASMLENQTWISELAFCVDILKYINEINIKLQGKNQLIPDMWFHIKSFEMKLKLLQTHIEKNELTHFPNCKKLFESSEFSLSRVKFVEAISILQQEFNNRFQDFKRHSQYFQLLANPFNIDVEDIPVELQMEIIDLQPQDILKDSFKASPLLFFAELPASFSKIKNIAAKYFSMFGSNYVCEQAFSHMKKIKNPYRSRLTDDHLHHVLRASTSNFNVEIENIINNIQQQKSH